MHIVLLLPRREDKKLCYRSATRCVNQNLANYRIGVVNKLNHRRRQRRRWVYRQRNRLAVAKFLSSEFGTKSQREVPYFWTYPNFLITQCGKEAFMPKPSSIRPVVSIKYRLVTVGRREGRAHERTHGDSIYRASIGSRGKTEDENGSQALAPPTRELVQLFACLS